MAAKSTLRVNQKVSFGDRAHGTMQGTIKSLNAKTATIAVVGKGTFYVSYNLIKSKARKTSAKKAPVKRKGKGTRRASSSRKMTAAQRKAAMSRIEAAWDEHEGSMNQDFWKSVYSNPAKKKRRKAKKNPSVRRASTKRKSTKRKARKNCGWSSNPPRDSKGRFKKARKSRSRRRR